MEAIRKVDARVMVDDIIIFEFLDKPLDSYV